MSYYKVLNLEETAKEEDIKKAYRQKALEYHPDKTTYEIEEAREKFRELDEAYKVLSNDDRRALYDVYHRHKEEIEKNSFLNPRIINLINKMYIEQEQEQQKQSLVNDVLLDQMPSIDIDLLLKIYDSRYHKNQKYYQQQARKICQFIEQKAHEDSSNDGDSPFVDYQTILKNQGNQLDRDFLIVQEPREREDNIETNSVEQFLKKIEEQKEKKNVSKVADQQQIQSNTRKESSRNIITSTTKNDTSKANQTFPSPFANFEEFHQKYFDLINSFVDKEDKTNQNNQSIQRYADCYNFSGASMPLLSLDKDSYNKNQQQQQQLTKKQIKHIWELTQQKKVKQRILKKKPVFILKRQLQKERKPIKLAELQQKIAEIQSQIQQQKQHYQKCRNRKEPLAPSILELSKNKYLELVQRKKLLTEQSFSLQRDDQQKEDTQPSKYGSSYEQYYNQLKADLDSSESQDNQISDQQQSQHFSLEDEDDVNLQWNGEQQEDEDIDNWIDNINEKQVNQEIVDNSLDENVSISPQQNVQLDLTEQPDIQTQDISNINSKQDLDLSLQKDNYQQNQYLWQDQDQPSQERTFNYPNEMKSILSQQQQQEYQLQQKQNLRPNTNIVENSSFAIPLKDSPFQIQEDLPESLLQGSPFQGQTYQDNYELNTFPSFLHQNSYQDQIYSPSLYDSELIPSYQGNLKDMHQTVPQFQDQF